MKQYFKEITKWQWLLLVILLLTAFSARIFVNVLNPDYTYYQSDSFFHRTLIDRIKTNQLLNAPMSLNYSDRINNTWSSQYITNYPKAFHYFVALIPLPTDLSLSIVVALFIVLLLLGVFLLAFVLSKNFYKAFVSLSIFIVIPLIFMFIFNNIYSGGLNYLIMYAGWTYPQLTIHIIGIYFLILGVLIVEEFKAHPKKLIVLLGMIAVISLVMIINFHNIFYSSIVVTDSLRMVPVILSLLLPVLSKYIPGKTAKIVSLLLLPICIFFIVLINLSNFLQSQVFFSKIIGIIK